MTRSVTQTAPRLLWREMMHPRAKPRVAKFSPEFETKWLMLPPCWRGLVDLDIFRTLYFVSQTPHSDQLRKVVGEHFIIACADDDDEEHLFLLDFAFAEEVEDGPDPPDSGTQLGSPHSTEVDVVAHLAIYFFWTEHMVKMLHGHNALAASVTMISGSQFLGPLGGNEVVGQTLANSTVVLTSSYHARGKDRSLPTIDAAGSGRDNIVIGAGVGDIWLSLANVLGSCHVTLPPADGGVRGIPGAPTAASTDTIGIGKISGVTITTTTGPSRNWKHGPPATFGTLGTGVGKSAGGAWSPGSEIYCGGISEAIMLLPAGNDVRGIAVEAALAGKTTGPSRNWTEGPPASFVTLGTGVGTSGGGAWSALSKLCCGVISETIMLSPASDDVRGIAVETEPAGSRSETGARGTVEEMPGAFWIPNTYEGLMGSGLQALACN
jgi:hypothetical protein